MKLARYAAVPVAAVMALTACAGQEGLEEGADGLTKITVGISPFQDTYLPIIGEEMGWFEQGSTIIALVPDGFSLCDGIQPGHRIRVGEPLLLHPEN